MSNKKLPENLRRRIIPSELLAAKLKAIATGKKQSLWAKLVH